MMMRGALLIDPLRHVVTWKDRNVSLTVTEFLLLQALAQRPGFVKSRDQLMDVAYDDQIYVDDQTIDIHIIRLRKKCVREMLTYHVLKHSMALDVGIQNVNVPTGLCKDGEGCPYDDASGLTAPSAGCCDWRMAATR